MCAALYVCTCEDATHLSLAAVLHRIAPAERGHANKIVNNVSHEAHASVIIMTIMMVLRFRSHQEFRNTCLFNCVEKVRQR